jgi:hypothetical protein
MGFTIPAVYPVPLENQGVPNKIRAATMLTLLERDRFVFANQRRMLTSLSAFFTANTVSADTAAILYVHNSKLTENAVTFGVYGFNAIVIVAVNGVTQTVTLGAAPDFAVAGISPLWTDDTWCQVIVTVQSTSGTGGYYGLYILEDPLLEATLP